MTDDELLPWTIRSSSYRIDEPFLRLRTDTVELPNGHVIENYFVRESRGFAVVAALTPARRLVLVRQYKHGVASVLIELPAGMIEPDEAPAACAQRELAEETGYAGDEPELLRTLFADPTSSDGRFYIYLVRNARRVSAQQLDRSEAIVVETASLDEVRAMLRDGRLASGPQVAAAFIALDHLSQTPS